LGLSLVLQLPIEIVACFHTKRIAHSQIRTAELNEIINMDSDREFSYITRFAKYGSYSLKIDDAYYVFRSYKNCYYPSSEPVTDEEDELRCNLYLVYNRKSKQNVKVKQIIKIDRFDLSFLYQNSDKSSIAYRAMKIIIYF